MRNSILKYKKNISFFKSNFLKGIGSVLNIRGNSFNSHLSNIQDDYSSLMNDWKIIGNDFEIAISTYKKTNK